MILRFDTVIAWQRISQLTIVYWCAAVRRAPIARRKAKNA